LESKLLEGKGVAIHCRQGIGRSALLAACLLILAGIDSATALKRVSVARGCPVPETPEQREWVTSFERGLVLTSKGET
jgi:protein-tyrosine phosphatase